ncbi:hypothetical protein DUNSADRAFT_7310, partial [Dunaliella salina]
QADDAPLIPQLLDTLRYMLSRSSKLAVALTAGNLVPCLLAMLEPAAPISRVKLLEIIRYLYEQCPRNKEVLQAQVEPVALTLFGSQGPGAEAVHQEARRLLAAFQSGN